MRMIAGFHNTQRTRIRILNVFVIVYAYDLCLSSLLFFFFSFPFSYSLSKCISEFSFFRCLISLSTKCHYIIFLYFLKSSVSLSLPLKYVCANVHVSSFSGLYHPHSVYVSCTSYVDQMTFQESGTMLSKTRE